MRLLLGAIAALTAAASPEADDSNASLARIRRAERDRIELIQRLMPSVVCVFPRGTRSGGGSGVIIDSEGYGLTNFHVIRPMAVERRGEGGLSDGRVYPLEVLGLDPTGDVAMFKLESKRPLYPAPLGESSNLRVGDWALAMGNPFLLAEDFRPTVTLGIVSGLHRYQKGEGRALVYTDCIQVDTSINPGNSGGPLFDLRGELVGINGRVSIEDRGRVNVGVGYAITIDQIRRFMPALRAGMLVRHGSLGATVRDRRVGQVIVDQILTDSCAHKAGLRLGDRVVAFAGVPIASANHLLNLLGTYPSGWPVTLEAEREGRQWELRLRLDEAALPKGLSPPKELLKRMKLPDPLRPNSRANARTVRRALERYRRAVRVNPRAERMPAYRGNGKRRVVGTGATEALRWDERWPVDTERMPPDAADAETWIRRSLLEGGTDPGAAGYEVVGGDEVRGRVAVVIRRRLSDGTEYVLSFDDQNGLLLGVEFRPPGKEQRVRFEYDDYQPAGEWRLPRRRFVYGGDKLLFEDVFENVEPVDRGA